MPDLIRKKSFVNYIFSENRSALLFFSGMLVSWIVFIGYSMIQGDGYYRIMFFSSGNDTFMDFYNSCRDAAQGLGCYTERGVIYPPMANLFYKFCNCFISSDYLNSAFDDRLQFASNPSNLMIFVLTTVFFSVCIAATINRVVEGTRLRKAFSVGFLFMSFPYIYMIERGNILIFAYLLSLIFVFFHDSENKTVSELSCIALAMAAAIKMYPAVLGLILVVDRRYRQAIRTVIYGVLAFVLPFGAYCWKTGFTSWVDNIIVFSKSEADVLNFAGETSVKSSLYVLGYMLTGKVGPSGFTDLLVSLVLIGICVLAFFILKERYQKYLVLFVLMDLLPGSGGAYSFVFLSIPLIMMFNSGKIRIVDYLYICVIMAAYMPFVFPVKFQYRYISVNYGLTGLIVLGLFVIIMIDLVMTIFMKYGKKKGVKRTVSQIASVLLLVAAFIGTAMTVNTAAVRADEVEETVIVYEDIVANFDDIDYTVRQTPDDEIPFGFMRCEYEYHGDTLPALKRGIGYNGKFGYILVLDLDDGNGSSFYTLDLTTQSLSPYVALSCNGVQYAVIPAKTIAFAGDMGYYDVGTTEINGIPVQCAVHIYENSDPDFLECNRYLLCLLDEKNNVGYYSYSMENGFDCQLELYGSVDYYPTPYPACIGNHTFAKSLNYSGEIITVICALIVFVPAVVISVVYLYIKFRREVK